MENIRLPRMGSLIKSQKMTAELTEMSVADRLGPRLVHNNLGNILLYIKMNSKNSSVTILNVNLNNLFS